MKLQLYGVDQAPRTLPIWQLILEDLADPPAPRVARVLGVSARTVYRWNAEGQAPRCASLALFWLTRWGRSEVHAAAVNDATLAVGYAQSLRAELDRAKALLHAAGVPGYEHLALPDTTLGIGHG